MKTILNLQFRHFVMAIVGVLTCMLCSSCADEETEGISGQTVEAFVTSVNGEAIVLRAGGFEFTTKYLDYATVKRYGDDRYHGSITIPAAISFKYNGSDFTLPVKIIDGYGWDWDFEEIHIPSSIIEIKSDLYGVKKIYIDDLNAWCNVVMNNAIKGKDLSYKGGSSDYYLDDYLSEEGYHLYLKGKEIDHLKIPNTIQGIMPNIFCKCESLTSIDIPNSVTSIGFCFPYGHDAYYDGVFSGCTNLKRVSIGKSVVTIGDYAFYCCTGLTSISIPNSVTSIGQYAFLGCTGLTSISIPNSVTTIGQYTFSGCSGLTSISIPNSVTTIGHYAFSGCSGLTSISIPTSVTSIGQNAFSGCSGLTSISIPTSVTSIGLNAFAGCTGLDDVYVHWEPPIQNHSYYLGGNYNRLHVPAGTKEAYQGAYPWRNFKEIIEDADDYPVL